MFGGKGRHAWRKGIAWSSSLAEQIKDEPQPVYLQGQNRQQIRFILLSTWGILSNNVSEIQSRLGPTAMLFLAVLQLFF